MFGVFVGILVSCVAEETRIEASSCGNEEGGQKAQQSTLFPLLTTTFALSETIDPTDGGPGEPAWPVL